MLMFLTFLLLGLLLGFAGAGGAGFVFAILISLFSVPIHTALGTSLAAMFFIVVSGAISHIRQGNDKLKLGMIIGGIGAVGSLIGSKVSTLMVPNIIIWVSAGLLFLSAVLIGLKTRVNMERKIPVDHDYNMKYAFKVISLGLVTGFLSGCFGIGATPLIQLGLMVLLGLSLKQSASISMVILIPISIFGALGYMHSGFVDWQLLLQIVAGCMTGSYIGAKFTNIAPHFMLRSIVIMLPIFGGILLLQ